jgi:hypothetical protein
MKTRIRSLLTLVCAVSASLLLIGSPAQAGFIVTLEQEGLNVLATGNGTIDLTGLMFNGTLFPGFNTDMVPKPSTMLIGPTSSPPITQYLGASGPPSFGSGSITLANSGTGDFVGIFAATAVEVPQGYMSNSPLSDSATWDNANFQSLGVTPGTYKWTWGTGPNQNFTLKIIGPATMPDSGSTCGLLLFSVAVLFGASRFRSLRSA